MNKRISLCILAMLIAAAAPAAAAPVVPQSRAEISLTFAPLVKQVTPAVVNIYTQKLIRQRVSPFPYDPLFQQFFGNSLPQGMTRERLEQSLGSGVMVRPDGLIVTSRHVIDGADQIRVVLSDRREFDAKMVLSDEQSDLALLRIEAKGDQFPYLELKDSDDAQVGDLVLAIGNPFGVGQTVTMGIISALTHKAIGNGIGTFIQTDAAINPGNSGGALVTVDGKLVGINAAIYSRDGGNMGIGFAVPSNMARFLMNASAQGDKRVTHPWVGLTGQEVSQSIATSLGMSQPSGFLVKNVLEGSPAGKAGIKTGDVIVSVNGREIDDPQAFNYRIAGMPIGSTAEVEALRAGKKVTMRVAMIAPPEIPARDETVIEGRNPLEGAKLANLSPALADEIGFQGAAKGVIVMQIRGGGIASRVGLAAGDLILAINGEDVENVDDAVRKVKQQQRGWRIKIRRGNNDVVLMLGP